MQDSTLKSQNIISVVISAYNSEGTIGKTLESLENQDIEKSLYEVIVMDDGSTTPRTREIVENYIQKGNMNLRYFYQKNAGVGRARNAGIAQSVGKYLAFTDADCILDSDWLSVIWRSLVVEKMKFIGGYTYSDDVVIFPWKMAPVHQTGITANMAVDFTFIEGVLFDSGFTGMLGDDTDFVLRMESKGLPQIYIPEMRVLHPPNLLTAKRIIIRARGRHNEVALYKKHGKKVLSSFSFIFRPMIFERISPFGILVPFGLVLIVIIRLYFGIVGLIGVIIFMTLLFLLYAYRFFVIYNPDGRSISFSDRLKTLGYFILVTPLFFYYRVVGMMKSRFFML